MSPATPWAMRTTYRVEVVYPDGTTFAGEHRTGWSVSHLLSFYERKHKHAASWSATAPDGVTTSRRAEHFRQQKENPS